jgi:hypothetical protein
VFISRLGLRSFNDFLSSRSDLAELKEDGPQRLIRLRSDAEKQALNVIAR